MGQTSLELQDQELQRMLTKKPFKKVFVGFEYVVFPKVFKGSIDSELLCKTIEKKVSGKDVWDIGTGTGIVALTAKKGGAKYVLATDINPEAIENCKENSKTLKLKIDVKKADVFGHFAKKFDVITFNPPFTDNKRKRKHDVNFWDPGHKTLRKFFKDVDKYLKKGWQSFIAWASFANTRELKRIAKEFNISLKEVKRKKGKRNFVYYTFELIF